jgi:hypothetical protein|tara:strand:- start:753 stop:971 length:219 start_codon:yes stop_codon:yes gene_type:complete
MPSYEDGMVVVDTPEGIEMYRRLAIRSALRLEVMGFQGRGQVFGLAEDIVSSYGEIPKGTKKAVLAQLEELL